MATRTPAWPARVGGLVLACLLACDPGANAPPERGGAPPAVGPSREPDAAPVSSTAKQPQRPRPHASEDARTCELVDPPIGLVDLRARIRSAIIVAGYHRADNFTGAPLPGYEAAGAWLEGEAAEALVLAASRLEAKGLRLIIYDAYRPRRASEAMVEWCHAHARDDLLDDGWVAARSAHGRGRAIDLGLARLDGTPLDMGSRWDQFDQTSFLRGVDGAPLQHRLELRAALVRVGFTPYAREWWHFGFDSNTPAPIRDRPYGCREAQD